MLVGIRILFRFSQALPEARDQVADAAKSRSAPEFNETGVEVAATAGGITNGLVGAWGPVVTPFLLHRGLPPRYAIGSVNTAEVAVAVVSAGTLITTLGRGGLDLGIVLAMLVGGVARRTARGLRGPVRPGPPARACMVAGLLLLTQSRELATAYDFPGSRWIVYLSIPVLVLLAALRPRLTRRFHGAPRTATSATVDDRRLRASGRPKARAALVPAPAPRRRRQLGVDGAEASVAVAGTRAPRRRGARAGSRARGRR